MLTEAQSQFLARRRKLSKAWPLVGSLLIVLVLGLYAYLFWSTPMLVNPYHVMERVKADELPRELALTMAMIMPLVVLWTGVLLIVFILFSFSMIGNERKLIRMVDGFREPPHEREKKVTRGTTEDPS